MTKYDYYWCSNLDWVYFDNKKGMMIREDAPPEAQESYRIYRQQVKEHQERLKEYERRGILSNH